jgi:hypothetical protein
LRCAAGVCTHHRRLLLQQALDDLVRFEQRFPFLFVKLRDGLRQPLSLRVAGAGLTAAPFAVSSIFTWRPSVGCGLRSTMLISSSAAMVAPIDCGFMFSARARSAVVAGPSFARRAMTADSVKESWWVAPPRALGAATAQGAV